MANPYFPNDTKEIKRKLLKTINIDCVEELFSDIDPAIMKSLSIPEALSEIEVKQEIESILAKNSTTKKMISFLGGGVWPHYVPSVIDSIANRAEFLTSYTPYQPEINQGLLQTLFEYQSMICELVEMDVANSSMYDYASALGEAARMAMRITGRNEFVIPHFIHPERLATLQSYSRPIGIKIIEVDQSIRDGQFDLELLKQHLSQNTAAMYLENPSYLGYIIEHVDEIGEIVHDVGGLFIVGVDPISLGVLKPPGRYGADIVIGEGQPLGNYMNYGGALLGIFACRDDLRLIRQLPGRIVGMTTTINGQDRGFCLTLQAREQHIRREKAVSNICTNEALCALRATIYMALMGRTGLKILGENILAKSHYAVKLLTEIPGLIVPLFNASHFKEFTVNFDQTNTTVDNVNRQLLSTGILGGKSLKKDFPELGNTGLFCITELHSGAHIAALQRSIKQILEG